MTLFKQKEFIFVLLLPLIFYLFIEVTVTHNAPSLCIFKFITGHECWGCGLTRAFHSLFHLQFAKAYEYNSKIIVLAPLLTYIWIETIYKIIKGIKQKTISTDSM